MFLLSVVAFGLGTLLTAFARTATEFVLLQMLSRTFMMSAGAVAFVIIPEEYPAAYRGWAIGMLGAIASFGHGLGAGLFSQIDRPPYGWRSLYAIGFVPLTAPPRLRRRIRETDRSRRPADSDLARVMDLLELGRLAEADRELLAYERLTARVGVPRYRWRARVYRTLRLLLEGRLAEAEAMAWEAPADEPRFQPEDAGAVLGFSTVHAAARTGTREPGPRDLADGAPAVSGWRIPLALAHAEMGRCGDAATPGERREASRRVAPCLRRPTRLG